jgi:hypothetical protein
VLAADDLRDLLPQLGQEAGVVVRLWVELDVVVMAYPGQLADVFLRPVATSLGR